MRTQFSAAGAVIAITLLLTGCSGSPQPSPTPSGSASSSPSPTSSPSASVDPNAPAGQCADSDLQVTVQPSPDGGSAGHTNSQIVFTNTGSDSCELRGAPGVSVLDAGGKEIGVPAERSEAATPATITLAAGGTAIALLSAVNIGSDGGPLGSECPVVDGASYRVYPPHSFTAFDVPATVPACSGTTPWLEVMAVEQG